MVAAVVIASLLFLLMAFFGLVLFEYVMRENRLNRIHELGIEGERFSVDSALFGETFELLTGTPLHDGSAVEILLNGDETFPRLLEDLRAAKKLITWHVYWLRSSRIAEQVKDVLMERARAGVKVFMLIDAFGSRTLPDEYLQALREAGVHLDFFRPFSWRILYKVQQRMHIRCVVIDGSVGYTGGFGIDQLWEGDGRHPDGWRDTNVRIEGAAVNQLQAAFVSNWGESSSELLVGGSVFHPRDRVCGHHTCGVLHTAPSIGCTNAERFFVLFISAAQRRLWITNPYFVPDDDFRTLLMDTASRGVDVRILTPGANVDNPATWYAARAHYEELLGAGIRIFEYRPTMIHAKTLVVDGLWGAVGTINFDNRSVMLNDEVSSVFRDEELARRLETIYLQDLEHSTEVNLEEFRKRSWSGKVKEQSWRRVRALL
ncbi:MAG: phospholipase D-like domain-containing protein [Thermoanaerobaculia bacterium]